MTGGLEPHGPLTYNIIASPFDNIEMFGWRYMRYMRDWRHMGGIDQSLIMIEGLEINERHKRH